MQEELLSSLDDIKKNKLVNQFKEFLEDLKPLKNEELEGVFSDLRIKINKFPNHKQLLSIYEDFVFREITRTYVRKRNWSKNEIILLVFIILNVATKEGEKLSEFKNWNEIAKFFPKISGIQCKLKWSSIQRSQVLKGSWLKEEDELMIKLISSKKSKLGKYKWSEIANALNEQFFNGEMYRLGKHCRERWLNHLNPSLNKGSWTYEEDLSLFEAVKNHGKKWASISRIITNRNSNIIKTRYHSYLKSMKVKESNNSKKDLEDSTSCILNGEEWKAVEEIIAKLKKKIEKAQSQSQPLKTKNNVSINNQVNTILPSNFANYNEADLKNISNDGLMKDFSQDNTKVIKEVIIKKEKEGKNEGNADGMLQANYEQLFLNNQMQMIRNMMLKNQMMMMERILIEEHLRTWGGYWRR